MDVMEWPTHGPRDAIHIEGEDGWTLCGWYARDVWCGDYFSSSCPVCTATALLIEQQRLGDP